MKFYVRASEHERAISRLTRRHNGDLRKRREQHTEELRKADLVGYQRGVEHGWKDAMRKLRRTVGAETLAKLTARRR